MQNGDPKGDVPGTHATPSVSHRTAVLQFALAMVVAFIVGVHLVYHIDKL